VDWDSRVNRSPSDNEETLRRRERWFLGALVASMVIATGPGALLVNRPETLFGFPILYVWGVAWYVVIGALAVAADRFVWRIECEREDVDADADAEAPGSAAGDDAGDRTPEP